MNRCFGSKLLYGQQAYTKMPSISNYQENANKNHKELSSDICQKGDYQKVRK